MKKFIFLVCAACLMLQEATVAQTPLPVDPEVKVGRLDNGLTYYIRHNEYPKDRAYMYIAQRVGAVLEEDSQNGLAHFLEHMAFNGTKNFPGKGIIDYLERQGVKFGENINAYTSTDETVYNLDNVPTTDPVVVDSALLVLHDWSGFISLEPKEIDSERGVIREEWRTRDSGDNRTYNATNKVIMAGTPYAVRDVIGDTVVINNFTYQELRDYYHKWYRPDLQGIVVVGDIDPEVIEQKIKEMWSDIPAKVNPAERKYFPLPLHGKEPIVSIAQDPEATRNRIELFYRRQAIPREFTSTQECYMQSLVLNLATSVMDLRFQEMSSKADSPFAAAGSADYREVPLVSEFLFVAVPKNGKFLESYNALVDEAEKLRRWGVTASELEVVKQDMLKSAEDAYNSRTTCRSGNYVQSYVRSFIDGTDIMSQEQKYQLLQQVLPFITKEVVDQMVGMVINDNPVISVMAPSAETSIPSKEELKKILADVSTKELVKYEEVSYDKPLVADVPASGKIVSSEAGPMGSTLLTLSNGIKAYLLPTDHEADKVSLKAVSFGGASLLSAEESYLAEYANYFVSRYGLGDFSASDLTKVLAGKSVNVSTTISTNTEAVYGNCAKGDFETMLQCVYLGFKGVREDADAHASSLSMIRMQLENLEKNPDYIMQKEITKTMYGVNPYVKDLELEDLEKLTMERCIKIYKERFSNAGDFTFFFVGDMDIEAVKPMIAQWLGSLPVAATREKAIDRNIVPQTGKVDNTFEKEMATTKVSSWTLYSGENKEYDRKFLTSADFLNSILRMRYLDTIREDEGGSYGVSSHFSASNYLRYTYNLQISFDTDPEKIDKLYPIIEREIQKIADEGPDAAQLQKVKDNELNTLANMLKRNSYWMSCLSDFVVLGIDKANGEKELLESISGDDVKAAAAKILAQKNRLTVTMKPKK